MTRILMNTRVGLVSFKSEAHINLGWIGREDIISIVSIVFYSLEVERLEFFVNACLLSGEPIQ